jgi:hypothetical protein
MKLRDPAATAQAMAATKDPAPRSSKKRKHPDDIDPLGVWPSPLVKIPGFQVLKQSVFIDLMHAMVSIGTFNCYYFVAVIDNFLEIPYSFYSILYC